MNRAERRAIERAAVHALSEKIADAVFDSGDGHGSLLIIQNGERQQIDAMSRVMLIDCVERILRDGATTT